MIWTKLRELAVTAVSHALKLFLRGRSPDGRALPDIQNPDILVIKPASIGDVLMATPVLECLRRALPGARVTLAVGSWSHVAVANSPDIDGLIDCGKVGTPGRYGLREYLRLVRVLRRRHFDVAIVLDRSPLMALLPYFAGVKYRLGLDSGGRGIGLTTASPAPRDRNEGEIYLDVLRAAGISADGARARFYPSLQDLEYARRLLEEWNLGESRVVVIAPGGGRNPGAVNLAKRWSPEGFARVADRLQTETAARVVLVGQESDEEALRAVARLMRTEAVSLLGQTSFGQLGALLQISTAFLGNDSAPGHLAAAVGSRTVTVFTDSDPGRFLPFSAVAIGVAASSLEDTCDRLVQALRDESKSDHGRVSKAPGPRAGNGDRPGGTE